MNKEDFIQKLTGLIRELETTPENKFIVLMSMRFTDEDDAKEGAYIRHFWTGKTFHSHKVHYEE